MKKFLVGVLVYLAMIQSVLAAGPVGTLGTIPQLTIAGRTFTDLTNLIVLYCYANTANDYSTCRKANGVAGYQVTSGKTYTISAAKFCNEEGVTATYNSFNIMYGTNDVGFNSSSAPTGVVRQFGVPAGTSVYSPQSNNGTGDGCVGNTVDLQVPQNDYVSIQVIASKVAIAVLYGYEN